MPLRLPFYAFTIDFRRVRIRSMLPAARGILLGCVLILTGCFEAEDEAASLIISSPPMLAPASPHVGEPVVVVIEIVNDGGGRSSSTSAGFSIEAREVVRLRVPELDAGESTRLRTTVAFAESGYRTLTVEVGPPGEGDGNRVSIIGVVVRDFEPSSG